MAFGKESTMSDRANGRFGPADLFQLWSDTWGSMLGAGVSMSGRATPPDAFREARATMLDAWSDYFQRYMRSPEFLEMLKQAMAVNIEFRKQLNDFFGQMQYNLQAASRQDVDQLMSTMRHLEHRVVDALERMSCRQDEIGRRLEALEGSHHSHD